MSDSVANLPWFVTVLKEEENGREVGRVGSYWRPHTSPEGGLDTIGYGHKLVPSDTSITILDRTFNLFTDKVPHKYVEALLIQDIMSKEKLAAQQYTQHQPIKGKMWEDLSPMQRAILTEINFNAGLVKDGKWAWPSLAKAIEANNLTDMMREINRTYTTPSGKVKPLTKRVAALRKAYKNAVKDAVPESTSKAIAEQIKGDFPHFDQLNDRMMQKLIQRYAKEDDQRITSFNQRKADYIKLEEQVDERERKAYEATLILEQKAEMEARQSQTPPAPEVIDETDQVIDEPLAKVEYFQREDGKVVKMVDGVVQDA